jgi:hypothetical protein
MTPVPSRALEVFGHPSSITQACPACGRSGGLIALGVRYERPHRWRPWALRCMPLALCPACEAVVVVTVAPPEAPSPPPVAPPVPQAVGRLAGCVQMYR